MLIYSSLQIVPLFHVFTLHKFNWILFDRTVFLIKHLQQFWMNNLSNKNAVCDHLTQWHYYAVYWCVVALFLFFFLILRLCKLWIFCFAYSKFVLANLPNTSNFVVRSCLLREDAHNISSCKPSLAKFCQLCVKSILGKTFPSFIAILGIVTIFFDLAFKYKLRR